MNAEEESVARRTLQATISVRREDELGIQEIDWLGKVWMRKSNYWVGAIAAMLFGFVFGLLLGVVIAVFDAPTVLDRENQEATRIEWDSKTWTPMLEETEQEDE